MAGPDVSHGRGGAGNIKEDDTVYADGEITKTGLEGSHGDGAFSAGRGGAGNIGDKGVPAQVRKDHDVVPEAAVRPSQDGDYHVGRGGAGNAHVAENKTTHPVHHSLADKLKGQILGVFKKKPSS